MTNLTHDLMKPTVLYFQLTPHQTSSLSIVFELREMFEYFDILILNISNCILTEFDKSFVFLFTLTI